MPRRDHLERAVLEALWAHPEGLTVVELVDVLADRRLALTTVHTVLDRLRVKSLVARERDGKVFRHRAIRSREEITAEAMLSVLKDSADHGLALSMFVQRVSPADVQALRQALDEGVSGRPVDENPGPRRRRRS